MGRRRKNGFSWSRKDGGATACTEFGNYVIEATTRGVVARLESGREVTGLGCYATVDRARTRCEQHRKEMQQRARELDWLTA